MKVGVLEKRAIGNYALDHFIGYGASSVVFRGFDLKCKAHGVTKDVAIKFIWHREQALDEVRRLEKTQGVFEICDLITYDEISGGRARELIGDTIRQLEKAMKTPLPIHDDEPVGILILKLVKGEHLIDRKLYNDEVLDPRYEWTVDLEHPEMGERVILKEWLTPVTQNLSVEKRIDILTQLARAIDASHELGVVHGDLNPWNIFYNSENGRISIIDLGRNNFGVQGWRAPEHYKLLKREISTLPKETDIRLLGQWMRYLLPKKGPWTSLIQRCYHQEGHKRPSTKELIKDLQGYSVKRPRRLMAVAALFCIISLAAGIHALKNRTPFSLNNDGFNRIAVLPFDGAAVSKTLTEMVRESFGTIDEISVVRGPNANSAMRSLRSDRTRDSLLQVGNSLGAQFTLHGAVEEGDNGYLTWTGTLLQSNGVSRKLHASGQNKLVLADAVAAVVLKLLGSKEIPLPASDFFSANINANFLYVYGNEFLEEGNINAATPMFEKAVAADDTFYWAEAKLAMCYYRSGRLEEGYEILERLVELPDVAMNTRLWVTSHEYLAIISHDRQEFEEANEYIEEALSISRSHGINEYLGRLFSWSALIKTQLGMEDEAGWARTKSTSFVRNVSDPIGQINDLIFNAVTANSQRQRDLAASIYLEALDLARIHGLDSKEAAALMGLGITETNKPKWQITPKALEYLKGAREIQIRLGEEYDLVRTEYNIARYYRGINEYKKAITLGEQALEKARKMGHGYVHIRSLLFLGNLHLETGSYDEAELYFVEALDQKLANKDLSSVYRAIWFVYAEREDFASAEKYLRKDIELSRATGNIMYQSHDLNNLGELFERQGAFEEAAENYEESLRIKRQIDDLRGIVWTLRNQVMLSIKTGQLDKADRIMDEVINLDPNGFETGLVLARLEYERGHFGRAYDILTEIRVGWLEKGRWRQKHETFYNLYAQAGKEGRVVKLPEQYGNH